MVGVSGQLKAIYSFQQDYLEVPCVHEVLIISPDKPRGSKRHLTNTGVNIRSIHLVPSMGPIVSVMTSHAQ